MRGLVAVVLIGSLLSACSSSLSGVEPPSREWAPLRYNCVYTKTPIEIDGRLDDAAWARAEWTAEFVDIEGDAKPRPRHRTVVKMLWDEQYLYIAADMVEPDLWATLTARDSIIFRDHDFEVFLDPDGDTWDYLELEINALGTEWDLRLERPYRDGGPAFHEWDFEGLRSAVALDGTLNDPSDTDRGWSVEIAIPWDSVRKHAARPTPPIHGDAWRINFSRVEWRLEVVDGKYVKVKDPATGKDLPEDNWVWSPQGVINMHYPEMWGYLVFQEAGRDPPAYFLDAEERAKWALRVLYYAQRQRNAAGDGFTEDVAELGLEKPPIPGVPWPPRIMAFPTGFEAMIRFQDWTRIRINQTGRIF